MKRLIGLIVAVLAAGMMLVTGAGTAQAAPTAQTEPEILWTGPIALSRSGDTVTVSGIYRCSAPLDQMHLWVSVKQGGPDPTAEGSSSTVDAWYDTNVSQDVRVKCDGKWHTRTVELGRQKLANYPDDPPNTAPSRKLGYLKEGKGWLQFCLVPPSPTGDIFASKSRWLSVVHEDD